MGRAWPVLCLLLTACSGPPIITEVTYKIRPNSEVPSDVRLIGVTNPSIAGAEKFLGQLADMLSVELAKSYQVTGPAALGRQVGDTPLAQARSASLDAVVSGELKQLTIDQEQGEYIRTGQDEDGNPVRRAATDIRLSIRLILTLRLVAVADKKVLATLRFERMLRQTHPSGRAANRQLTNSLPNTDLAVKLEASPTQAYPGKATLLHAMAQQCAREFQREMVPFEQTFQVQLLRDGDVNAQGLALMQQRFPAKAAERFLQATDQSANSPDVPWYNLGVAYEQTGRYAEARAAFRNALGIEDKPLYRQAVARVQKYGR